MFCPVGAPDRAVTDVLDEMRMPTVTDADDARRNPLVASTR
jgi:hypothetical protein